MGIIYSVTASDEKLPPPQPSHRGRVGHEHRALSREKRECSGGGGGVQVGNAVHDGGRKAGGLDVARVVEEGKLRLGGGCVQFLLLADFILITHRSLGWDGGGVHCAVPASGRLDRFYPHQ